MNQLTKSGITEYNHPVFEQLKVCSIDFLEKRTGFKRTVFEISRLLSAFNCECENENHYKDNRIKEAIEYLENNVDRIISVKEISKRVYLSESRFLHLFKENTGITYRKVQQWNRISQSFSYLKKQSLTETAYQFGFTDSAHYSKVFKQTFGFNPKLIQKS